MDTSAALKDILAGTIAGIAGILATQPLDILRIRLQTGAEAGGVRSTGMRDAARHIFQQHGARGFFAGMPAPLVANAPINATIFATERAAAGWLQALRGSDGGSQVVLRLLSGGISGLAQVPFSIPSELVKLQLQVDHGAKEPYSSSLHCAREILRTHGIRGLYRGGGLTTLRDVSAFGIYFLTYHELKNALLRVQARLREGAATTAAADAAARSAMASVSMTPHSVSSRALASALTDGALGTLDDDSVVFSVVPGGGGLPACERCSGFCSCSRRGDALHLAAATGGSVTSAGTVGLPVGAPPPSPPPPASSAGSGSALAAVLSSPALALMLAGGMAGVASWAGTYPVDTMKSLVQGLPLDTPAAQRSIAHLARHNAALEGGSYRFLWRGFAPTMSRAFVNSAVVFSAYEGCVALLERYAPPQEAAPGAAAPML